MEVDGQREAIEETKESLENVIRPTLEDEDS